MSFRYRIFGLVVETDVPLDPLPMIPAESERVDVRVLFTPGDRDWIGDLGEVAERRRIGDEEMTIRRHPFGRAWTFPDDTSFLVSAAGTEIVVDRPEHYTVADAATYVLGPILGSVLRRRGVTTLHASVVDVGGCGVALVGSAGAGKSTLAAALAARGHRLVAEDVAPLRREGGRITVTPGLPFVKLWPRSAQRFGDLPAMTPNWDKRYLDATDRYETDPVRLASVCLLSVGEEIGAAPLAPRDALVDLIANVYGAWSLTSEMRARDLELLGDLVDRADVWRVSRTDRLDTLDVLADVVLETL